MARGVRWLMWERCRLFSEKTNVCDERGMSSAFNTDARYPRGSGSKVRPVLPFAIESFRLTIASFGGRFEYWIAAWSRVTQMLGLCADSTATPRAAASPTMVRTAYR